MEITQNENNRHVLDSVGIYSHGHCWYIIYLGCNWRNLNSMVLDIIAVVDICTGIRGAVRALLHTF